MEIRKLKIGDSFAFAATIKVPTKDGEQEVEIKKRFPKANLVITEHVKGPKRFDVVYKKRGTKASPQSDPKPGDNLLDISVVHIQTKEEAEAQLKKCKEIWPHVDFYIDEEKPKATLTHPDTGFQVKTFSSLAQAMKAAQAIEHAGIVFPKTTNPKEVVLSKEHMNLIKEILRMYP